MAKAKATVLLVGRIATETQTLEKRYLLTVVASGKQALAVIAKQGLPDVIVLDAVSLRTPGERISKILRGACPNQPMVHIHPGASEKIDTPADVLLVPPFTSRKLINNIERLLKKQSVDAVVHCGPFTMNVSRRLLVAYGQESQLTPKLALLVEFFLRHPNETIDRKQLMEVIWKTDYLGDTRTLDVHIRWVRKALENGGEHPRHLNTVRGIGYRLDVPELLTTP